MEHPDTLKGPWTHGGAGWHPNRVTLPYASYDAGNQWGSYLPGPMTDGIADFHEGDAVCGADSLRKLLRWFPALYRRSMAPHGFVVRELEVPREAVLGVGRWQVAFDRRHPGVRLLDEHPPAASPSPLRNGLDGPYVPAKRRSRIPA
jgi:hypothetical protein